MKILKLFFKLSPILFSFTTYAQSLDELYQFATQNTSVIKQKKYSEQIAFEKKSQTRAQILPSLTANSSNVWREKVKDVGAFGESHQHTAYLSLQQPLFQGGAEYHSWQIAKRLPQIARLERLQQEIELYTRVANAFYELLKLRNEAKTLLEQQSTLSNRVKTLIQRAKIGRSKKTDVLAAESQAARVTAELAQLTSQIEEAEQKLKSITGLDQLNSLSDPYDLESMNVMESWQQDLLMSPKIQINELLLENHKKEIDLANANYFPKLDVEAKYYLERAGILRDSDWDVTLNASWELFSGGQDRANKRIKTYEMLSQEAVLKDNKRVLVNEFKSLKAQFLLQKDVIKKMHKSVQLAKNNYLEHVKEVDRGLVNQLDLLRVLEEYQQVSRTYVKQKFETKKMWIQLRALAGVKP